jgi:hypothetical protein
MIPFKRLTVAAALLALGGLAQAEKDEGVPYDVAPDEPKGAATGTLHAPARLSATDGVIDSGPSWGHSGPWVEDVDGDGRRDLVVGDFSGLFRLYRNEGTNREPRYAAAVNLRAGDADAKVPIY